MDGGLRAELHDLVRSVIGALLLGTTLLFTMETWWLGWRLPAWLIVAWAVGGLAVISLAVHNVGFHQGKQERDRAWWQEAGDFATLFLVSFVAGLLILFLIGVVEWGDPPALVLRLALVQVVPLGLGAAIANRALGPAESSESVPTFKREAATFAMGALFFALPVAPTEEMDLIAAHAGPWGLVALALASIVFVHVALYMLEFRGHRGRAKAAGSMPIKLGSTLTGYLIALALSWLMLAGFGHFIDAGHYVMLQQSVVLGFVASVGGAAARVVV